MKLFQITPDKIQFERNFDRQKSKGYLSSGQRVVLTRSYVSVPLEMGYFPMGPESILSVCQLSVMQGICWQMSLAQVLFTV